MNHPIDGTFGTSVEVRNAQAASSVVLVCEHASGHIPVEFDDLGLSEAARASHIAWDPGALALACEMAARLDAVLVASKVSRLVYDCNRPPYAPDAMPARSEIYDIPGNRGLSTAQKSQRVEGFYQPFYTALTETITARSQPVVITIHSFTPIYYNRLRSVEIGVLHDADRRLADVLLASAADYFAQNVQRNAPYGPEDGVTHTLMAHALPHGHLNVMLEVRNDLLADAPAIITMASAMSAWVTDALDQLGAAA